MKRVMFYLTTFMFLVGFSSLAQELASSFWDSRDENNAAIYKFSHQESLSDSDDYVFIQVSQRLKFKVDVGFGMISSIEREFPGGGWGGHSKIVLRHMKDGQIKIINDYHSEKSNVRYSFDYQVKLVSGDWENFINGNIITLQLDDQNVNNKVRELLVKQLMMFSSYAKDEVNIEIKEFAPDNNQKIEVSLKDLVFKNHGYVIRLSLTKI